MEETETILKKKEKGEAEEGNSYYIYRKASSTLIFKVDPSVKTDSKIKNHLESECNKLAPLSNNKIHVDLRPIDRFTVFEENPLVNIDYYGPKLSKIKSNELAKEPYYLFYNSILGKLLFELNFKESYFFNPINGNSRIWIIKHGHKIFLNAEISLKKEEKRKISSSNLKNIFLCKSKYNSESRKCGKEKEDLSHLVK